MKITMLFLLSAGLLAFGGCSSTNLVSTVPDPATGKMMQQTYTKYYDAGVWLVPEHLGMSVVVDQMDEYSGKITVYAWNRDKEDHELRIQSISSGYIRAIITSSVLLADGGERSGLEVGKIDLPNDSTAIELDVTYELDDVTGKASLRLERRTPEELERFFGKHGKPPYPWSDK